MEHHEEYQTTAKRTGKQHNILPLWGNEATMNLNPLILANIQGSSYFKVHLFKLKTYHEVVDEIYYQVKHLEPWERGSRKTAGQTGMCGGVRGVGAGGIVSTAFCLLYKLYTLRLTRKQVNGLLGHTDSPYIRALGFMYIRYTQPPGDLYDWYEDYLLDEEEIDVKAGGGQIMTIGQMAYQFLTKLDWFSTLFPRIPVPMQKQIEKRLIEFSRQNNINFNHLHQTYSARQNNSYTAGSGSGTGGAGGTGGGGGGGGGGIGTVGSGGGGGGASAVAGGGAAGINAYYGSTSGRYNAGGASAAGGGGGGGGFNYNDRDRANDRGGEMVERRRRDDRDFYERERERERVSREYYGGYRDNNRRDDRYNRSKSRSRSRTREEKQKSKKKSKNKDRDRSKDRKEKLHHRERSPERYRERERERDKRYH